MAQTVKNSLRNVVAATIVGSDNFVEWIKEKWIGRVGAHRDVPATRKLGFTPDLLLIKKKAQEIIGDEGNSFTRKASLFLAHQLSGLPLGEIGKFFGGISASAVTQNTNRFQVLLDKDEKLAQKIEKLKEELSPK